MLSGSGLKVQLGLLGSDLVSVLSWYEYPARSLIDIGYLAVHVDWRRRGIGLISKQELLHHAARARLDHRGVSNSQLELQDRRTEQQALGRTKPLGRTGGIRRVRHPCHSAVTAPADPIARIRVGTWNVQFGRGVDKNRLRLDVLTERDADVWVLTETHDDLALPYPYQSIHTEQRYRTNNGGRWTSIWTRFPIIERIDTIDPSRTVCARLQADTGLEVVVYGTVLPWMHDRTSDADDPRPAWSEFYRVTDQQAVEWKRLRGRYPSAALVVAGDLNHNLGGPHYYGTNKGRNSTPRSPRRRRARMPHPNRQFPARPARLPAYRPRVCRCATQSSTRRLGRRLGEDHARWRHPQRSLRCAGGHRTPATANLIEMPSPQHSASTDDPWTATLDRAATRLVYAGEHVEEDHYRY